ncbi:MAG: hypothetical protein IKH99_03395 [Prevotella sp.]|nr:hypothetical protein [Prevotella sp.]
MKNQYAWHSIKGLHRIIISLIVVTAFLPSLAQTPLNEQEVYERLMYRQYMEGYQEGTPWDDSNTYFNTVVFDGYSYGCYKGRACFAFMMDMMEYASNYEYPIRKIEGSYDNLPKIHVGDGVRVMNDCHSVVVLEVDGTTVTVAEGNFNSSVHWGRTIDLANPAEGFTYIATFWPEVSNTIATGITDNDIDSPIGDLCIYHLNGTLIKRIPQTGESIKSVLSGLPKGFYIVKEATKTYKVYNGE